MARSDKSPVLPVAEVNALFTCPVRGVPLFASDLADLGLRTPDPAETVEDYCDAELLDPGGLCHLRCLERGGEH